MNDQLRSFSLPFHCLRDVKLEQPVMGANYLKGVAISQPGGNWAGEVTWKMSFNKGGCIDFGKALLQAADIGDVCSHCSIQFNLILRAAYVREAPLNFEG